MGDDISGKKDSDLSTSMMRILIDFLVGSVSAAISKTATAPFECISYYLYLLAFEEQVLLFYLF